MEKNGQLHDPGRVDPTEGAPRTFLDYYNKRRKLTKLPRIE
jgi:hypothetical protein